MTIRRALHADTFTDCILYCDMYSGCAAVTYVDGNNASPATNKNCFPYSRFRRFSSQALQNALFVSVPVAGPNNATDFQDNICEDADIANGGVYHDVFGAAYTIQCGSTLIGADELACMATDTLEACVSYCSLYDGCIAGTFSGTGKPPSNECNCFPRSSTGQSGASTTESYGIRIFELRPCFLKKPTMESF